MWEYVFHFQLQYIVDLHITNILQKEFILMAVYPYMHLQDPSNEPPHILTCILFPKPCSDSKSFSFLLRITMYNYYSIP